jgi:hypothetical protein
MVPAAAMSKQVDTAAEAQRLDGLYRAKARAEIAAAEALVTGARAVRGQGDVLAEVLLLKGEPGAEDRKSGRALSGSDGVAIGKALDALGLPKSRYAFCTRPGKASASDRHARLRMLLESLDPETLIALDTVAAADLAAAYGAEPLVPGVLGRVGGRPTLAVEDFEAALSDEARKRRVWGQLRALARPDSD